MVIFGVMKKMVLILLFLMPLVSHSLPIDTNVFKYFPLNIGNSWTYYYDNYWGSYRYSITVTKDSTFPNGKKYYQLRRRRISQSDDFSWVRIDSTNGNLLERVNCGCPWLNGDCMMDSLNSKLNDSCITTCSYFIKCIDTTMYNLFGISQPQKKFYHNTGFNSYTRVYMRNIGLIKNYTTGTAGTSVFIDILGCYVNGIFYGDTNLVGIKKIHSEIPKQFSLSQNYPNPFNPNTKIHFAIPNKGLQPLVQLKVFDVLGREVTTLVNEELKPGTYEVDFDGTNYPSGVYYYRLIVNSESSIEFSETKKMVLMK